MQPELGGPRGSADLAYHELTASVSGRLSGQVPEKAHDLDGGARGAALRPAHADLSGPSTHQGLEQQQRQQQQQQRQQRHDSTKQQGAPAPYAIIAIPRWQRWYMVSLFSLLAALLFADQNLLAPNLSMAAADFGMTELEKDLYLGGYVMAGFFLIGAPAALVAGWLADRYNRVLLLFLVIIIGETPCLATYWVTNFWQFFALRMLTGISVGGCFPLVFSLLGDLFPSNRRVALSALVQIATSVGIGVGQMVAGVLGPATSWRVPFVVMAVPALALALLMLLTTREPQRGGCEAALAAQLQEGVAYSERIDWAKLKVLLRVASNWLIVLQGLPGCLPWGMMLTYMNDYLSHNKGFSVQVSTVILLLFGLGGGVGIIAGAVAGQLLYNRWRPEGMALLSGFSVLLGIPPAYYIINGDLQAAGPAGLGSLAIVTGFIVSIPGPNLRATLLNVNEPETRGMAIALQSLTDDLGKGLGPIIVAALIGRMGRQQAFNLSVAGWVPCGLLLLSLVFCMRRDEQAMQARLEARAQRAVSGGGGGGADGGGGVEDPEAHVVSVGGLGAAAASRGSKEGGGRAEGYGGGEAGGADGGAPHGSSPRSWMPWGAHAQGQVALPPALALVHQERPLSEQGCSQDGGERGLPAPLVDAGTRHGCEAPREPLL